MRVLYINHTLRISGAGVSLATLLRNLPMEIERYFWMRPGCELQKLFGVSDANVKRDRFLSEFPTTMYNQGYSPVLYCWHFLKGLAAIPRFGRMLRRDQIDLVHINESTLFAYVFAAAFCRRAVVLHARTALAKRPIETFMLKAMVRLPRVRIVAIDEEVKMSFPVKCHPFIEVVYNPIETGKVPERERTMAQRREWGIGDDDIVVGQVASLHSHKGIWMILDIAEILCAEMGNLRFVLAGDASPEAGEGPALKDAVRKRGLEGRVILPGYQGDLALLYSTLDIALCLFGEGLGGVGRTAYEAALYGKPLIATLPDPENSTTLKNGETGLLFAPGDRAGIIDGMRRLVLNPDARGKLGGQAKEAMSLRHDPIKIADRMVKIYSDLLAQP